VPILEVDNRCLNFSLLASLSSNVDASVLAPNLPKPILEPDIRSEKGLVFLGFSSLSDPPTVSDNDWALVSLSPSMALFLPPPMDEADSRSLVCLLVDDALMLFASVMPISPLLSPCCSTVLLCGSSAISLQHCDAYALAILRQLVSSLTFGFA